MNDAIHRVKTNTPGPTTLQIMGRTATDAGKNWTVQKWAAELAATAGPKDYTGQLKAIYDDLVRNRWRYVMEPGERVPGTPRALLRYVLGTAYNGCDDESRCQVVGREWKRKGFGDCDDVSALVGAASIAIGMRPVWRVARWDGGAHVSTMVRTPDGNWVSVDPVGHPDKPFGWALVPDGGTVEYFDLAGRRVSGIPRTSTGATSLGALPTMAQFQPTYMRMPRAGLTDKLRTHFVATRPGDTRGARSLAMPLWSARIFRRGLVVPHQRAVDQFGEEYQYLAGNDLWVPVGGYVVTGPSTAAERYAFAGFDFGRTSRRAKRLARRRRRRAARAERRARRRAKFAAFRKKVGRAFQKLSDSRVASAFRTLKAKAFRSPLVKKALGTVLQAFGVPPGATAAVLEREAALADRGGRSRLAALVADGRYKDAAKLVGGSLRGPLRAATKQAMARLEAGGGMPFGAYAVQGDRMRGANYLMRQADRQYQVSPVAFMSGCPYSVNLGATEVQSEPTAGFWFRPKRGDSFLGTVGTAFGVKGSERLKLAQMIARAPENAYTLRPPKGSFEEKYFPGGLPSYTPKFNCSDDARVREGKGTCYPLIWFAPAEGVRAPEMAPEPEPVPPVGPPEPSPVEPAPAPAPVDPVAPVLPSPTPTRPPPPADLNCPPGTGPKWVELFRDPTTGNMIGNNWICSIAPTPPYAVTPVEVPETPEDQPDAPPPVVPTEPPPTPDPEPMLPPAKPTDPEPPEVKPAPAPMPPPPPEQPEDPDDECPDGQVWSDQTGQCIPAFSPSPSPIPVPEPLLPSPAPSPPPYQPPAHPQPGSAAASGLPIPPWWVMLGLAFSS